MNKISCDMCLDLMPLVRDGVAGADSRAAVEEHLAQCENCRAVFEQGSVECDSEKALLKTIKNVQRVAAAVLVGVVLLGIILCEMVMQGSSMIFVLLCWLVVGLVRFALRRDKGWIRRIASLCLAVALILGICWAGNEVFGNPITKERARSHIAGYLEGAYADSDYYIADVDYIMSAMTYEGEIRSETDETIMFYVVWRRNEVLYDTFKTDVLGIWE